MLTLILTACLTAALQDEPTILKHATKHEFTLSPKDPVLEGIGPSKTIRYVLESDDSVLFVYAESPEADLVLRAQFDSTATAPKPSGAAALIAGKKRVEAFEDDDSGGGTTPFLRLERKGHGTLLIQAAAKRATTEIRITVHCFEARESAATRAAAAASEAALEESQQLAQSGDLDGARANLAEALNRMLETPGADHSAAIHGAAENLGLDADRLSDLPTTRGAWSKAHDFHFRTLPPDHPDLQVARFNLAATTYTLGDLEGARDLLARVYRARG